MRLARREILAGLAAGGALAGCDRLVDGASRLLGADLPEDLDPATGPRRSRARHLLDRAAFGPWPGDEARVAAMGAEAWIDEQLRPERLGDAACSVRTSFVDLEHVPGDLLFELAPAQVERQLTTLTLLRAVYSRRRLREVLVHFWSDHFSISIDKDLCQHLKALDDREVIRPHALGSFPALLRASALSPAMLVYLDGRDNAVGTAGDVPNENYARELLELHTLGVDGGYTQDDVMEAARCLTGWVVWEEGAPGQVVFDPARHDDGPKRVLGQDLPAGGGEEDLDRLLRVLVDHPSCAPFVAGKLTRAFLGPRAPQAALDAAAATFRRTGGDIAATVRGLLLSEAFHRSQGQVVKRPFHFLVGTLRLLAADTHGRGDLQRHLTQLGQAPFRHPTPDGYPADGEAYLGTLVQRWRFALDLAAGRLDDTRLPSAGLARLLGTPERLFAHLVGRAPDRREARILAAHADDRSALLALTLSSPAYQRT